MNLKEESIFIKVDSGIVDSFNSKETIHIKRFYTNDKHPPVLMFHGSIENGKIFYSSSGKGLAPYLAANDYDVFVIDYRGRGLSTPTISKASKHGLKEIIQFDIPAFVNKVKELKGDSPQHWIAHSQGGIILLAHLARNQEELNIASITTIGTRRKLRVFNFKRIWQIDFIWGFMGRLGILTTGYVPAKEYKAGSDNETKKSFLESRKWIRTKKWLDWYDNFNYSEALFKKEIPASMYITGENDFIICHPKDMQLLMEEVGMQQNFHAKTIGKSTGYKNNYGHIDILTHQDAPTEVYPFVLDFIDKQNR